VVPIKGDDAIRQAAWQFTGQLSGWNGYLNRFDGYAHSANALTAVYRAAQAAGVRFFLGEEGVVNEVVYENTLTGRKCAVFEPRTVNFIPQL